MLLRNHEFAGKSERIATMHTISKLSSASLQSIASRRLANHSRILIKYLSDRLWGLKYEKMTTFGWPRWFYHSLQSDYAVRGKSTRPRTVFTRSHQVLHSYMYTDDNEWRYGTFTSAIGNSAWKSRLNLKYNGAWFKLYIMENEKEESREYRRVRYRNRS